jgi:pimeloyl-ACP methyl ester carboxylesterase
MEIVPRRLWSDSWEPLRQAREHYRSLCAPHSRIQALFFHEACALRELDGMKRAHTKMWNEGLRPLVYLRDLAAGRAMIFKRLSEQGVTCPMMLINGVDDPLVDIDRATVLVSALAEKQEDVELHLLADCGHFPQLEKGEIVAGIIRGFVHQHST